jgi:hydroxymethylpyrimidine/phosphomethylpyrimidine kinase
MHPPTVSPRDENERDPVSPVCIMLFNANDPSGAGGLAADISTAASIGCHALPVVTGAYARDTAEIYDHFPLDEDAVLAQARATLEDMTIQVIKVGFAGSPDNLGAVAGIAADYPEIPLVAYMPNLSWWDEMHIDQYHDAFKELILPQTTVLVGNHSTLWRWLLPDWSTESRPSPRDIARAAQELGVPYTLVTGIALPDDFIDNVLATPEAVVASERLERFDAAFSGAGDTFSTAFAALLATGCDLAEALHEALSYLDRCLEGGFHPGMGNFVPDRLFWAQPEPEPPADTEPVDTSDPPLFTASFLERKPNDTQH